MAYNGKTNWQLNEIVKPEDMNRIEQGIIDANKSLLIHNASADAHKNRFDEFVKGVTGSNATLTITKGNDATSTVTVNNVANATNATNATKATQDSTGQQINSTYIKGLSVSGKTITYTKGNNTTGTITTQDTVYTHPNSGVSAGTYKSVTVNAQGHVTAGSNPTTLAGYGITDAPTKTGGGASGTWGINISGNAASANKLASESGSNYLQVDTTKDSWDVLGSNPGAWLKSVRTNSSAPPYSLGNFSAAIAFGGSDTKGIITHAYDGPIVKFAGGNGSTATWKFAIKGGYNNETYNLNDFPTKTGGGASGTWGINITGNAASATAANTATLISGFTNIDGGTWGHATGTYITGFQEKGGGSIQWRAEGGRLYERVNGTFWQREGTYEVIDTSTVNNYAPTKTGGGASGTWGINISGNSATSTKLNSRGNQTAITAREEAGLYMHNVYNNGYPCAYGNVVTAGGSGGGQLLLGWSGTDKGIEHLYYRNRRDAITSWSDWRTLAFTTDNVASATKATQDSAGQQINTTYIKGLSASNATLTYTKGNGTTGKVTVNNVATATNADKLDGYHYSDIVTKIQGKTTPTMTALVDWEAMTTACNLSPATVSVSTVVDGSSVTLSVPSIKTLRNISTGIMAYDGDVNSGSMTGTNRPFYAGDIILKQSYKNFDKILIVFCNDEAEIIYYKIWEKWELEYAFNHSWRFWLVDAEGIYWRLRGTKKQGTTTNQRLSTDTFWRAFEQNAGIVEIYGLKY